MYIAIYLLHLLHLVHNDSNEFSYFSHPMDAAIAMPRIFHEVQMLNDAVNSVQTLPTQLVKLILA